MPTAKINDAEMYYEIHGQGHPLMLISGYTCDHLFWSMMLEKLARKFQVVLFDNRAIGQTKDSGAPFTLDTLAEDTVLLAKHLGLNKPHIVGHSMGGSIAQIIGYRYADQISKLAILNSSPKFNPRTMMAVSGLLNLRKNNVPMELQLDVGMPWFFSSDFLQSKEKVAMFKNLMIHYPNPQSVEDHERQFNALGGFDARPLLSAISAPTLVMSSNEDIVDTAEEGEFIAANIKGAQFVRIAGGHSSPVERPDEVAAVLLDFLA